MIRKTLFLEVLEDIHKRTDMRYGQIISNALKVRFGGKECDCGKDFMSGCKCKNDNGRGFNTFGIWDEDLTEIVEEFRFRIFPDLKRIKLTRPKTRIGTFTKKDLKHTEGSIEKAKSMARREQAESGKRRIPQPRNSKQNAASVSFVTPRDQRFSAADGETPGGLQLPRASGPRRLN